MKSSSVLLILLVIVLIVFSCRSGKKTDATDDLALFSMTGVGPKIDKFIPVPSNEELTQKVKILMDSVSSYNFNDLEIEVLGIESGAENVKTLKINLKEKPGYDEPGNMEQFSWYNFFQGSEEGQNTTAILIESALQKQYEGEWIDAVEFFYNGEKMGEWDHINLAGTIKRK